MLRAVAIALALTGPAVAEPVSLKRGVNLGLWLDWLSMSEMMADPATLDPFPDWQRDTTPRMLEVLAEQGFDFVRMPTDPGPMLAYGPGADQDRLIAGIHTATQTALDAGLKVVVDLHPLPRGDETGGMEDILEGLWPDYVTMVARLAADLATLPQDRVVLELLNEPTFDCEAVYAGAPPRWPAMQAELVAAIRATAPDLTLVLTGACWSQASALASLDPALIQDDNVLWTFHSYEPFLFSHQGAVWTGPPAKHVRDLPYPPSAVTDEIAARVAADAIARMEADEGQADRKMIEQAIADYREVSAPDISYDVTRAAEWADQHGIPRTQIYFGEFGALHTVGDQQLPREWFHAFLFDKRSAADAAGIPWAVLTYVGDMGIAPVDDPERRLAPETCVALGLSCAR